MFTLVQATLNLHRNLNDYFPDESVCSSFREGAECSVGWCGGLQTCPQDLRAHAPILPSQDQCERIYSYVTVQSRKQIADVVERAFWWVGEAVVQLWFVRTT